MGIRKFIGWFGSWLFSNSAGESGDIHGDDTPEEGMMNDDQTIPVAALVRQQPSFDTELEHDDQPGNKKRKANHDSIVIYDHEQGSSSASSSQPICQLDWLLSNDPGVCRINEALRCKLRSLFARAIDVSTELKHDEIQPKKKRRMEVHQWLTDVYQIRDEVQKLATDGKSIEHFTSQVDELLQRGNFPNGYVLPDDSPIEFPLSSKNLAGEMFASNTAKILEWLKNNERCIIGVYGMGGVGKTTLLRWIYNEVLKQDIFGRPYWVTVSQNCDELKLQNEIAKELGIDLSAEGDDRKRAAILHKRLSTMGPTVLFLDDMWKWNPFLGKDIDFPIEGSNCKIILSSRSRKVCKEMGCKGFIIETKVLPEGEAWNLFVDKLGHYDKLTEEVKGIARLIAKECGGLPLAIATMARSMTDVVDVCVWNDALTELRQSSCEQSDMEEYVFSVLKYSYNRLNDQRLQNCFLSCILYPEDEMIGRETLIEEWIMEGLLDDVGSRSEQLNKGHTILNKLINSCLLEACTDFRDSECVKMHDLMRDLAIMITKGYPCFMAKSRLLSSCLLESTNDPCVRVHDPCFMTKSGLLLWEEPEEEQWSKGLVKVSLSHNMIREIPNGMAPLTPELTVLMLNNNPLTRIPESFFMYMRALTVLDLSHTSIVRLPESVSDLANLRALLLVECNELTYVPSLAKLSNLRALLLARCHKLTYVPSLAKLSNLRVLDLDVAEMLEKAPDGIENLKCLEKVTYLPWDVSDSTGFNKLIQSLPSSISCYKFWLRDPKLFNTIKEVWEEIGNFYCILNREFENEVWVAGGEIGDDETTYMLPATIKMLDVYNCHVKNRRNLGDVFPTLGLATDLKEMHINDCKGLKYVSSASSSSSSSGPQVSFIENIELRDLPDLRGIIEFGRCSFSHLCKLQIIDCPKIKVIFPLPEKQLSLPNLKYLFVSDCAELEEIFDGGGSNGSSSSTLQGGTEKVVVDPVNACYPQPNPISVLPKLKIIHLEGLPKVGSICKDLHLCTFLEKLKVDNCPKIERIFEAPQPILALPNLRKLKFYSLTNLSSIHRGLLFCTSLELLIVESCEELEEIFERDGRSSSSSSTLQGGTETLAVDPINACIPHKPNPVSALPKLKIIILKDLPKLGSIYKDLHLCTSLNELIVWNCKELEEIFTSGGSYSSSPSSQGETESLVVDPMNACYPQPNPISVLPKLKTLDLYNLPKLGSIYKDLHLCTSLEELKVDHCPKIERIFEAPQLILALPNLRKLKLDSLTNLSSIHRGLLFCTSLEELTVESCEELEEIFERDGRSSSSSSTLQGGTETLAVDPINACIPHKPNPVSALPKLKIIILKDLPKLGSIYKDLHLCTSLNELIVWNCKELEEIFTSGGSYSSSPSSQGETESLVVDPMNACYPQPNPISVLPKLKTLDLYNLPKLGSIYKDLHLCTSLEELKVDHCPKIERIFEAPQLILALPNLRKLKLDSLTNLSSIHRGLLFCTSLEELTVESCEELEEIFERDGRSSSSSSTLQGGTETLAVDPINACIPHKPNPVSALPKLKIIILKGLPKLGSIYKDLHLCTSLNELIVWNCKELEEIFTSGGSYSSSPSSLGALVVDPMNACYPQPNPISVLPKLKTLDLYNLPKLGSIYKDLHLCTLLEYLSVWNCKELEEIFTSGGNYSSSTSSQGETESESLVVVPMNACYPQPNPISVLPKLKTLDLYNLPKLGSIYKDLHLCTSLEELEVDHCPKIERIFEAPQPILALPNLRKLKLDSLTNLSSIHRGLLFCTSLEELTVESCEVLEEIFERDGRSSSSSSTLQGGTETLAVDPINACIPHKPNPVSALPKLKIIILKDLPKLGSIYKDLHLCTSLKELEVMDCPKIERIFEAPEPILALPGLRKLKLLRLQYLSSIHKGLLLCTSLDNFSVEGCFKLKKVPLSDHLICDDSPPSLLSLPSESHNPELWELLQSKYSEDARLLSDFVQYHVKIEEHNQNQLKLKRKRSDLEGKTRDFTDCIDQVSLPASLLPAADEDKNNWLADQLLLPRLVLTEDEQNQISAWGASLSLS